MFACVWGAIRAGKRFVRESPFGLALAGWAGAMLLWMAFTWPEKLSRLSFFSQIKIERAAVVSSFILLLLVFKLAQVTMRGRHICCGKLTVAGCLGLSYSLLALSLFVNPAIMNYFVGTAPLRGVAMLALGALLLAMVTVGLLRCNRWAFMGGYAAVALLSGAYVNPVSRGAAPLKEKQLTEAIHGVVRGHGGGTWLCSSATIAQFVRAQGLACINGVQQTADTEFWRRIDPTERFKFAWNRYAHVSASIAPPGKVSAIVNPMAGDCITWALDVAAIRTLDVRYLLWSGKKIREPWVEYLGRIRLNFIYKVRDPPLSCRQPDPSVPKEPNVRKPSE